MTESRRYLENAWEILKNAPVQEGIYTDVKYVKTACGVAYLGVLEAINDYLMSRGFLKKKLPKSVEAYREALRKYLSPYDGRLLQMFESIYEELHISGYYRGGLRSVKAVQGALETAERFIQKLTGLTETRER